MKVIVSGEYIDTVAALSFLADAPGPGFGLRSGHFGRLWDGLNALGMSAEFYTQHARGPA